MNEAETRAELIDPKLKACGWGVVEGSSVLLYTQTIVGQLDALRAETQKLEAVYQKKIADLDELKKSILQKAFAGELPVGQPAKPKTENNVYRI
jgi:predicted type IV restriction endonuclease